jgi:hypothetical protein
LIEGPATIYPSFRTYIGKGVERMQAHDEIDAKLGLIDVVDFCGKGWGNSESKFPGIWQSQDPVSPANRESRSAISCSQGTEVGLKTIKTTGSR